jgi:hypothetical protein
VCKSAGQRHDQATCQGIYAVAAATVLLGAIPTLANDFSVVVANILQARNDSRIARLDPDNCYKNQASFILRSASRSRSTTRRAPRIEMI